MSCQSDLSGKVVLLTGTSQGIGAQIARTFPSAGAPVVLNHPNVGTTGDDARSIAAELNAACLRVPASLRPITNLRIK